MLCAGWNVEWRIHLLRHMPSNLLLSTRSHLLFPDERASLRPLRCSCIAVSRQISLAAAQQLKSYYVESSSNCYTLYTLTVTHHVNFDADIFVLFECVVFSILKCQTVQPWYWVQNYWVNVTFTIESTTVKGWWELINFTVVEQLCVPVVKFILMLKLFTVS